MKPQDDQNLSLEEVKHQRIAAYLAAYKSGDYTEYRYWRRIEKSLDPCQWNTAKFRNRRRRNYAR